MSNHVALTRLKTHNPTLLSDTWHWYVLMDRKGKVRDWAPGETAKDARKVFAKFRDYRDIPTGYTVERRGPVTKENW